MTELTHEQPPALLPTYDTATIRRAHSPSYKWKPAWKGKFLEALRASPNVTQAAKVARVNRQHTYWSRQNDPLFNMVVEDALAMAVDRVEDFAFTVSTGPGLETKEVRRTVKREWDPDLKKMRVVEDITVEIEGRLVSPQMAMFLLAAHRKDTYSKKARVEHTGEDGGPVVVEHQIYRPPTTERALELARIAIELDDSDVIDGEAEDADDV